MLKLSEELLSIQEQTKPKHEVSTDQQMFFLN
jgi:hypothetical protein